MNKEQAKNLIIKTFENSFNKENFVDFITNLLKSYDRSKVLEPRSGIQGITQKYLDFIGSWERIGRYEDKKRKKIDILVVKLKKETSLYRARSAQRNFIADYLKGRLGTPTRKDAALVAFISPDDEDWRFSLVKIDYHFEENKSSTEIPDSENVEIRIKEEFTPAKRWSFLVGKNEKSHTAQSRFLPILENDEWQPTLDDLMQAFDVEVVTKEFFEKYRDLFIKTKLELDKIVKNDFKVKEEFSKKGINSVDFTKKLLGQIVFLYFLQKKGWFGVERGKPWGTGPKDFIRRLFNKGFGNYKNFYNDILEPLFYEALRTNRSIDDNYYSRFNCKIPFLNGGLFDPPNNFDWENIDIDIPDEIFSNSRKTKEGDIGDGILDIFDRYNFTVNEEEPLEKEVALDPELLGKIYEKLNAIRPDNFEEYVRVLNSGKKGEETKFNKEYGVYYTPREIVHYMCQESLINYLETELSGKVQRKDIEEFVKYADLFLEHERTAIEKKEKIEKGQQKETKYEHIIPESIIQNAEKIDKLLTDIKVCDPAVGSGAFPIGMMQEIVKLRQLLSVYLDREINTYELKRHCIENSLYGVDIDPGAVEICKLRFWLSMIVDEEDFYNIKPLPNLDYKVVCGDSLMGIEKSVLNWGLFNKLEQLKSEYFNETNPLRKQQLKSEIDKLIYEITNGHKEFDFEVYFSEVFHQKGGFDIVIANPPYISFGLRGTGAIAKKLDTYIRKNYPNSAEYKISMYAVFIDKGIQLLNEMGTLSYITPDSFLLGRYFSKLRNFILKNSTIRQILMFEEDFWESGVVGRPTISIIQKKKIEKLQSEFILCKNITHFKYNNFILNKYSQKYFETLKFNRFRLFFSDRSKKFVETIEKNCSPLGELSRITTGVRSKIGQKRIIADKPLNNNWKKGIISSSQVLPYKVIWKGHYINIDKKILWSGGWDPKIVENPKIMLRQTGDSLISAIDNEALYHLNNVHSVSLISNIVCIEYICAILNSKMMNKYYHLISLEKSRVMAQVDIDVVEMLPIKIPGKTIQEKIKELVQKYMITCDIKILNQIEELIMNIYELKDEMRKYVNVENLY